MARSTNTASPEALGIDSRAVRVFIEKITEPYGLHSFVLLRRGEVVAKAFRHPYQPKIAHQMGAVSINLTAAAIGLLLDEDKIALSDTVAGFFAGRRQAMGWAGVTVRHLLTMSSGLTEDVCLRFTPDNDWLDLCLTTAPTEPAGIHFRYISANAFLLSAIVSIVTGESLLAFLQKRLFDRLGFGQIRWDESPDGITAGAFGLWLSVGEMAALAQLFLQEGHWEGQRLLPEGWVQEATRPQISTQAGAPRHSESALGYGYSFWMGSEGTSRAEGFGGQYMLIAPRHDLVLVTTAGSNHPQGILDAALELIKTGVHRVPLPENATEQAELVWRIATLSSGDKSPIDVAFLSWMGTFNGRLPCLNADGMRISVEQDTLAVTFHTSDKPVVLTAGLNRWHSMHEGIPFAPGEAAARCRREGSKTIHIDIACIQTPYSFRLTLTRAEQSIHITLTPLVVSRNITLHAPASAVFEEVNHDWAMP